MSMRHGYRPQADTAAHRAKDMHLASAASALAAALVFALSHRFNLHALAPDPVAALADPTAAVLAAASVYTFMSSDKEHLGGSSLGQSLKTAFSSDKPLKIAIAGIAATAVAMGGYYFHRGASQRDDTLRAAFGQHRNLSAEEIAAAPVVDCKDPDIVRNGLSASQSPYGINLKGTIFRVPPGACQTRQPAQPVPAVPPIAGAPQARLEHGG